MSLNRARNIFTLGNFQLDRTKQISKRRQPTDPFERDPFKIQSYKFRYADRPYYPLSAVQQRPNPSESIKDCQTFFYNYDFQNAANTSTPLPSAAVEDDARSFNLSKFQEYRRRKFLQEMDTKRKVHTLNSQPNPNESKILNTLYKKSTPNVLLEQNDFSLYSRKSSLNRNLNARENSSYVGFKVEKPFPTPPIPNNKHQSLTSTPIINRGDRGRSLSSGCEINIKIKSLDDNNQQDKVNISIETDSMCRKLNIPLNTTGHNINLSSPDPLVIDKRLSKFQTNYQFSNEPRKLERDRVKELTSIYSSHFLKKPAVFTSRQANTNERLPSLIPYRTHSAREKNTPSYAQENLMAKKSMIQRVKENLRVYDSKIPVKSNVYNSSYRSPYGGHTAGSKRLNSSSSRNLNYARTTDVRSESKAFSPLSGRTKAKLPLNVNINVYTDKLKLLKV